MPEGDTIFRTARALHRALAGKVVTRFESVFPAITRIADDHPIVGRTIESVAARGKHLLMVFSGHLTLHTHMRMNGSWHLYPAGAPWQRPSRDMRVLVATADAVAVGFNVPIAELLTPRQLARHKALPIVLQVTLTVSPLPIRFAGGSRPLLFAAAVPKPFPSTFVFESMMNVCSNVAPLPARPFRRTIRS
jgi:hypothetical protein